MHQPTPAASQHRQPFAPEEGNNRGGSTEMQRHVDSEVVRELPAAQLASDNDVARGGDREELGQPLDYAKHDGAQDVLHPPTSIRFSVTRRLSWSDEQVAALRDRLGCRLCFSRSN